MNKTVEIKEMIGKVFSKVQQKGSDLHFISKDDFFLFFHQQDCCESFELTQIDGDLSDLENANIITAEFYTQHNNDNYDSITYTFYKFATIKGYVTVRWTGESNGYYSETVDIKHNGKHIYYE